MKVISHNMGSCLLSRQGVAELEEINSVLHARVLMLEGSEAGLAMLANARLEALTATRDELTKAVFENVRLVQENIRIDNECHALKRRLGRRI